MLTINVEKKVLAAAIKESMVAISAKAKIPILKSIQFGGQNGKLKMTSAMDRDFTFVQEFEEGDIQGEGNFAIDGKLISNLVKKMKGKMISITQISSDKIVISDGKFEFTTECFSGDDYPRMPKIKSLTTFTTDKEIFLNAISKVSFAKSLEETRPILTGVLLKSSGNSIEMVATDSHRLSMNHIEAKSISGDGFRVVARGKGVDSLPKIKWGDNLTIEVCEEHIVVSDGSKTMQIVIMDGNYPDTIRLIPTIFNTEMELDKKEMLESLESLSIVCKESQYGVVRLDHADQNVKVSAKNTTMQGNAELFAEKVSGDDLAISFNPDYVKEALKVIDDEKLTFQFITPVRPFVIKSGSLLQLITPVRTN